MKISNLKLQIPNKFQIAMIKILNLENWDLFVVWCLGFGA